MKRKEGFTLIELLMVILIIGFVLSATSEMFISMLRGYRQQSAIAESNIEGIIGLEILRRDLESAGYGLPWTIPGGTTYADVDAGNAVASVYNDSPSNPPRAFLAGNNLPAGDYITGSDYLVVKALNVAGNSACTKWNYLSGGVAPVPWAPAAENLSANDRVIVISPGSPEMSNRTLISPTGDITASGDSAKYSGVSSFSVADESRLVYGVDPDSNIRRPFNRADYYVKIPSSGMPRRCAPGTGILYKAVLQHANDNLAAVPLLDCVADMQVVAYLDTNAPVPYDGAADTFNNGYFAANANTIRTELKEIRVFILAHEGQLDTGYNHQTNPMLVGQDATFGRSFDFTVQGITNWQNYRWKVYTLVVKPNNLR